MKKITLLLFIIILLMSCSSPKTVVIHDYNSTIEFDSINIRDIGLKDAYEAFGYPDTFLVEK